MVPCVPDVRGPRRHEVYGCWCVLWYAERDGVGRRSSTLLDLSLCQGRVRGLYVVVRYPSKLWLFWEDGPEMEVCGRCL